MLLKSAVKQARKVPIQTLVNRIFVTQHRSKVRVAFAYVSFTFISSHLTLGPPMYTVCAYMRFLQITLYMQARNLPFDRMAIRV